MAVKTNTMKISNTERIRILEEKLDMFYKWMHYWQTDQALVVKKHDAVRVQNFEMASQYRDQEKANYEKWVEINNKLIEHSAP